MKIALQQLNFMDTHVKAMGKDIENHFRMEFEVTSLYRIDDNGVHGTLPCRGLDLGCKDEVIGNRVADYINSRWVYDPERPDMVCCIYHKVAGGQSHLHLQSHPNTERFPHD